MVQHGAYQLLMQHYYLKARPLPANAELLHRVCRCTNDAERSAMDSVLREFFNLTDGVYRHTRIDDELEKSKKISEKRSAAAKSRHANDSASDAANADAIAHANAEQKDTQSQPQVLTTPTDVGVVRPDSETATVARMSEDWQPNEAAWAWINSFNVTPEQAAPIILEFKNYWLGRSQRRADWSLAFVRNGKAEGSLVRLRDNANGQDRHNGGSESRAKRVNDTLQAIARRETGALGDSLGGSNLCEAPGALPPQVDFSHRRDRGTGSG